MYLDVTETHKEEYCNCGGQIETVLIVDEYFDLCKDCGKQS